MTLWIICLSSFSLFIIGPFLVLGVDFLLLLEAFLVLLLRVLLSLFWLQESAVEGPSVIANKVYILFCHCFLIAEQFLQKLAPVHQLEWDCVFFVEFLVGLHEVVQHLWNLFGDEGNRPLEDVHEVGQKVRMLVFEELLNVESVVLSIAWVTLNLMTAPLLL